MVVTKGDLDQNTESDHVTGTPKEEDLVFRNVHFVRDFGFIEYRVLLSDNHVGQNKERSDHQNGTMSRVLFSDKDRGKKSYNEGKSTSLLES